MKATSIIWRRTFPECAPGTDGVALFEGRIIGRVRLVTELPHDPKLDVERHRPGSRRTAGLERHARRNGLTPAGYGSRDRALAGAAHRLSRVRGGNALKPRHWPQTAKFVYAALYEAIRPYKSIAGYDRLIKDRFAVSRPRGLRPPSSSRRA